MRRIAAALVCLAALLAPVPAAQAATVQPHGPDGSWVMTWNDEFNGDVLSTKWRVPTDWEINNVTPTRSDVRVRAGRLELKLSSETTGGAVLGRFVRLDPGETVEARIRFPGNDTSDHIYNFPAFWTAGVDYPSSGEHDVAEGLGDLKTSYFDGTKTRRFKATPAGDW